MNIDSKNEYPLISLNNPKDGQKELRKLADKREDIPKNVELIQQYCYTKNIGIIFSRNEYASNCRDARSKRSRLGHIGIPLFDEMKSIVCHCIDNNRNTKTILLNCRGHLSIDYSAVREIILQRFQVNDIIIAVMDENELINTYSMEFGTVNPIIADINSQGQIIQLFDESVYNEYASCTKTMMTNAGNHTWAMEFDPKQIVKNIRNASVERFAVSDVELNDYELSQIKKPKTIGIITGNGPDSGMALWQLINNCFVSSLKTHFLGDISLPKIIIVSVPEMGLSMELNRREEATWEALSKAVNQLKESGAELLSLACHTTHYFAEKITRVFDDDRHHFISMAEVVTNYIFDHGYNNIAILGISYVADLDKWSAYQRLRCLTIEKLSDETIQSFHTLGYKIKKMTPHDQVFREFVRLMQREITAPNVLIALTELSVLLQRQQNKNRKSNKNIIDALEIYAMKIVEECIT